MTDLTGEDHAYPPGSSLPKADKPSETATSGFDCSSEESEHGTHDDVETSRERPAFRSHSTYEQDHWETAHVERVDLIGAYESAPFGDGPIRSRETIRVDLDGYGHPGGSMHGRDENLQVSFWLTPETALELVGDLVDEVARNDVDVDAMEGDR